MAAEAGNFTTVSGRLLDILANETRSLPSLGLSGHHSDPLPLQGAEQPLDPHRYWSGGSERSG